MTIILFIIVLSILVFVHELGHFLVAKKAGVKVEEFGFGYPPRAFSIGRKWGTLFSLNWIPFGGFVKIFGENYEDEKENPQEKSSSSKSPRVALSGSTRLSSEDFFPEGPNGLSFTQVPKKWQVAILAAGVAFNMIFAWLLFSLGFMIGLPAPVDNSFGGEIKNPILTIIEVLPESPAGIAGLKMGDKIRSLSFSNSGVITEVAPEEVSELINQFPGQVGLTIDRGGEILDFDILPRDDLAEGRKLIGINTDMVGILSLPVHQAFWQGGKVTFQITYLTVEGLFNLIKDAVRGQADISAVTGPVGIVGLVGDASRLGFAYLLTFTALISINLAIINLIPFPALDGGRIIFVIIEAITRKPINPKVASTLNNVGFALLIILMLIVTYRDILNLF